MEQLDFSALQSRFRTKSAMIRYLHEQGLKIAEIARALGVRYQFAYNVIQRYSAQQARVNNNLNAEQSNLASPARRLLLAGTVKSGAPPTREDAEAAVRTLIAWVGENPARDGLVRTPYRVASALEDLCEGYTVDPASVMARTFPAANTDQDMVLITGITVHSLCEHHMLPFVGVAHVAYIPDATLVGLSKISRLVEVLSRRLQTQERLTRQIADCISAELSPKGVAVYINAEHDCMKLRGVKMDNVRTSTTCFMGEFEGDSLLKSRFLSAIKVVV